jgi:predicted nucleotidyltransferase
MEFELAKILGGGRKVDMNTPCSLSRYFRNKVLAEAQVQYGCPQPGAHPL